MLKEIYENIKLQRRIDKLAKKYEGKRVLLYGAGRFIDELFPKLNFSKLNIVAVSDIKYECGTNDEFHKIKCINPTDIHPTDYDVILTTVLKPSSVLPFLNKIVGKYIKIEHLMSLQNSSSKSFNLRAFFDGSKKDKNNSNEEILYRMKNIERKLSMPDNIWQTKDAKFYVPYYPIDLIQRIIVNNNTYFEYDILVNLDKYLPDNPVILDIGANIGNHTLYWTLTSTKKAAKIYSFEPVKDTFEILKKNVELNNLSEKVVLYNFGLSDCATSARYLTYNRENIGDTHLISGEGDMKLVKLDDIEFREEHIDFVKIDVESMELPLLKGAKQTLLKYKPAYIFIESEYHISEVTKILNEYGYEKYEDYPQQNWLFKLKG